MKCQSLKLAKWSPQQDQVPVSSGGKNRQTQYCQESVLDFNNQGRKKYQDQSNPKEVIQNVRQSRTSPSKFSPRSSPTFGSFYAGAKFSGAPSPTDLPKPPSHWTNNTPFKLSSGGMFPILQGRAEKHYELATQMKILVNAPA